MVELVVDTVVEHVVDTVVEHVVDTVVEPVVDIMVEPVMDMMVVPVVNTVVEPVVNMVVEPVVDTKVVPVVDTMVVPVVDTIVELVVDLVVKSVVDTLLVFGPAVVDMEAVTGNLQVDELMITQLGSNGETNICLPPLASHPVVDHNSGPDNPTIAPTQSAATRVMFQIPRVISRAQEQEQHRRVNLNTNN